MNELLGLFDDDDVMIKIQFVKFIHLTSVYSNDDWAIENKKWVDDVWVFPFGKFEDIIFGRWSGRDKVRILGSIKHKFHGKRKLSEIAYIVKGGLNKEGQGHDLWHFIHVE